MKTFFCILIGYLLGSLSPSALLAKLKHINLRAQGTHNLGASNALLVMGKKYGAIVMVFDIFKAYLAVKIARLAFPKLVLGGLMAGFAAVVGHCFPFYLNFRGGKGLACFGGLVLAVDPAAFLGLLTFGLLLMFLVNYSYVMPMSAATLFPVIELLRSGSIQVFLLCAAASLLVIVKHWSNIGKAKRGEETPFRQVVREKILARGKG